MISSKTMYLQILIIVLLSCHEKQMTVNHVIDANYEMFFGVSIEARKEDSGKYAVYKFTKELGDQKFILPNYKYYNDNQLQNDSLFDIAKYGNAKGLKTFSDANNATRKYSDSVLNEFEKTKTFKIFSSEKQGHFIIFYLNTVDFIAYVPDKSKVYNDFWKEKINDSKQLEPHWFAGKY